jgi:flagellar motor switch protein FliG
MTRFDPRVSATPSPHHPPVVDHDERILPIPPLRKAAILIVSLDQSVASQVLGHLNRRVVEAVTLEIARLDRITPEEQLAVHVEFLDLGIRRLRFGFEDIVALKDEDIVLAYHDEDAPTWALALAGAARPVREKVLGALPLTAAESLRRATEVLGPFRLDDTEAAQAELAEQLRRLQDHGRLILPDTGGQEEVLA